MDNQSTLPDSPAPTHEDQEQIVQPVINPSVPQVQPLSPDLPDVNKQSSAAAEPITQAQILSSNHAKGSHKKLWVVVLLIFICAAAAAGIILFTDLTPINRYKTVTYDNGKASSFSMKFYKKYTVKDVYKLIRPEQQSSLSLSQKETKALVAMNKLKDKAPLAIEITKGTFSQAVIDKYKDCPKELPKAISVYNLNFQNYITLCALQDNGNDILYIGVTGDDKNLYIIMVLQDVDYTVTNVDKNSFGLQVYKNDLKQMMQSLKVVK